MLGSSQEFVDLTKFQYFCCPRSFFSSASPDSKAGIKKAPKLWSKPGLSAYLLHKSEILGWLQSSWVASLTRKSHGEHLLTLHIGNWLIKHPDTSYEKNNFRFAGVSTIKVLKHEFLKSIHFGLIQEKKPNQTSSEMSKFLLFNIVE